MSEIKFDERNYRIHNEKNKRVIRRSLENCGAGRSVLMDNDNVLIAGNGVYEQAQELGLKVRIIESDGKELIAIKRTDLSTEDDRRKALALADNHSSDTSVFDIELVMEDFSTDDLDLWEFSIDMQDFQIGDEVNSDESSIYSRKIIPPTYEPKNEKPEISELFDSKKTYELIEEINNCDISEQDKNLLLVAASRHTVFNYAKIADYYAHSPKEVQHLMEKSALIIIDFDKAIEYGFVELTEEIKQTYAKDYDEE